MKGIRALAFINSVDQLRMKEMKLKYNEAPIVVLHSDMTKFERQQDLIVSEKGNCAF